MASFIYESAVLAAGADYSLRAMQNCTITCIRIVRVDAGAGFPAVTFYRKSARNAEDIVLGPLAVAATPHIDRTVFDYQNGEPIPASQLQDSALYCTIAASAATTYQIVISGHDTI